MTLNGYLTVKDLAERLGVSATRVRQLILAGRIKAEQVGRDKFISEGEAKRAEAIDRPPGRPRKPGTA